MSLAVCKAGSCEEKIPRPASRADVRWCRVWLGAVALIGYIVLFNLLVVVAQMMLNRAHAAAP